MTVGLSAAVANMILDSLFSAALAVERFLIARGLSLPFGGSVMIVAARDDARHD